MDGNHAYKKAQFKYMIGYVASAILTLFVYGITVSGGWTTGTIAIVALVAAAVQLIIQSRYFLHLDEKTKAPRWRLYSYLFTWLMLLVVVIGSLWIMMNLNYNMMMSPDEMLQEIIKQNGKGF